MNLRLLGMEDLLLEEALEDVHITGEEGGGGGGEGDTGGRQARLILVLSIFHHLNKIRMSLPCLPPLA